VVGLGAVRLSARRCQESRSRSWRRRRPTTTPDLNDTGDEPTEPDRGSAERPGERRTPTSRTCPAEYRRTVMLTAAVPRIAGGHLGGSASESEVWIINYAARTAAPPRRCPAPAGRRYRPQRSLSVRKLRCCPWCAEQLAKAIHAAAEMCILCSWRWLMVTIVTCYHSRTFRVAYLRDGDLIDGHR
jgi:hypothetical protein